MRSGSNITTQELRLFLEGLSLNQPKAVKKIKFNCSIDVTKPGNVQVVRLLLIQSTGFYGVI